MFRRKLLADVVQGVADRLEAGYRGEVPWREKRLRLAFADALGGWPEVAEVRTTPEWRPEMPFWPWGTDGKSKLGGFDVAVRFDGDSGYSLVAELKWSHYGYVNALDEVIWDAFKLAHATSTLPGISYGLLIYLAPLKAWEKPARFADLFSDALASSRTLISEYESIWRWCLGEGSSCRPTKLPPYVQTGPVACASVVVDGAPWEIRASTVAANGEPWIELDENGMPVGDEEPTIIDWPYPAPGPGMVADDLAAEFEWPTYNITELPNEELSAGDVPPATATWSEISWFAAHFDGYTQRETRRPRQYLGQLLGSARKHRRGSHSRRPAGLPLLRVPPLPPLRPRAGDERHALLARTGRGDPGQGRRVRAALDSCTTGGDGRRV
jgi:hypothetical protein